MKPTITDKQEKDIGTNGLLKRRLSLNIFNTSINVMLSLILLNTLVLSFSGGTGITIAGWKIPPINQNAALIVSNLISTVLGFILNERQSIISYYFGGTVTEQIDLNKDKNASI